MYVCVCVCVQVEGCPIHESALDALAKIGTQASLRYVVQLLTPARILATTYARTQVTADDIIEINSLFRDAKTSAKLLAEQSDKFLM